MRTGLSLLCVVILALFVLVPAMGCAYISIPDGGGQDCSRCHQITMEDASAIVNSINPEIVVTDIARSPIAGMWEITFKAQGKYGIAYINFKKTHIVAGSLIEVTSRQDVTARRIYEMSRVALASLPIGDALVLGEPAAPLRAVVFESPVCPHCKEFHRAMKTITTDNPDIAFFIKMLPQAGNADAYAKSKAVVCDRSLRLLERFFEGKELIEEKRALCETAVVDETIALAQKYAIEASPSVVLPDGGIVSAFAVERDALVDLIRNAGVRAAEDFASAPFSNTQEAEQSETAAYAQAARTNTIESYREFLARYTVSKYRQDALARMADIIRKSQNMLFKFREFVADFPDGLDYVPEQSRLLYIGPKDLPVYAIMDYLEQGAQEQKIRARIINSTSAYREFSPEEAQLLRKLGLSQTIIDAMVEATVVADRRAHDEARISALEDLINDIVAAQSAATAIETELHRSRASGEQGESLKERRDACRARLRSLDKCKSAPDIKACHEQAINEFLCE